MVNSQNSQRKIQAANVIFTCEYFASLTVNPKFKDVTGQTHFALSDLESVPGIPDGEEQDLYDLGLQALFGSGYNPGNIGVYDAVNKRLYACSFVKTSKDSNAKLVIVFGDFYNRDVSPNVATLAANEDGKFFVDSNSKASISLLFQTEKRLDKHFKAYSKEVPYLAVESRVLKNDQLYNVSYLVPIRFEQDKEPSKEALKTAWVNSDVETLLSYLSTPFKGGGGWMPLMALGDSYRMAGLELSPMDLKVLDWEELPPGRYANEMDLILDKPIPVLVSKPSGVTGKMFIGRNITKIRIRQSDDPGCLFNLLVGLKKKKNFDQIKQFGFVLQINGFNSKNPLWTPDHTFRTGEPDLVRMIETPQFDQLIPGLADEQPQKAVLPESKPVDVTASTVIDTKALIGNVDPNDPDCF